MVIDRLEVSVYELPLDEAESDGTIGWTETTAVVVELAAEGVHGIGYTYGPRAVATTIRTELAPRVLGRDVNAIPAIVAELARALRNFGRDGVGAMAISAVDVALWDCKARAVRLPLARLLGLARSEVPAYGSGGFTSLSLRELEDQLSDFQSRGFSRVKMKVGREPAGDCERVARARAAIGQSCELFVDGNGAYDRKDALRFAERIAEHGVVYFEEPVSSDDLDGLRLLRDRLPMAIAAGEYGWDPRYFRRMLEAGAVDILQADATRCCGITGFLAAAALADAFEVPLSSHCAPSIHLHAAAAAPRFAHLEWFVDHARAERLLFDGVVEPLGGALRPDLGAHGLGLTLRRDAARFRKE